MQAWLAAGGFTKVKAYSKTIADLTSVLANAPSKTVKIDLDTQSADLTGVWSQADTRRPRPLSLLLPLQGRVENVNRPPSSPGAVEVQFARLLVFAAGPLAKENPLNPDLKDYTPWYNSAALKMALQDPDAWLDHRWGDFFNIQSGSMLRCCTSLVVVDGVRTVTRPKPIAALAAGRNGGAPAATAAFWPWPWTSAVALDGLTKGPTMRLKDDGSVTIQIADDGNVTIESKEGNPLILGVNVQGISEYLGAAAEKPPGSISVRNVGWFYARFSVCYRQDRKPVCEDFGKF